MTMINAVLRQAFMPKQEYENLREDERAWGKIQKPLIVIVASAVLMVVVICILVSLKIVFPGDAGRRPFCGDPGILPVAAQSGSYSDLFPGAFYLTDQETADYFWMVVFIPSAIVFFSSVVYLAAGMIVAYNAPSSHGCLKVVENNCCASKRGKHPFIFSTFDPLARTLRRCEMPVNIEHDIWDCVRAAGCVSGINFAYSWKPLLIASVLELRDCCVGAGYTV